VYSYATCNQIRRNANRINCLQSDGLEANETPGKFSELSVQYFNLQSNIEKPRVETSKHFIPDLVSVRSYALCTYLTYRYYSSGSIPLQHGKHF
jgi:hypothetical protein